MNIKKSTNWRKLYRELIEALVGTCAIDELDHEEVLDRASRCFYGRTRMNTEDGRLPVGDSRFEEWYAYEYTPKATDTDKQHAREAYEEGMNDPITLTPSPTMGRVQEWMHAIDAMLKEWEDSHGFVDYSTVRPVEKIRQEIYECLFGKRKPARNDEYLINVDGSSGRLGACFAATNHLNPLAPPIPDRDLHDHKNIDVDGSKTGIPGMNVGPGTTGEQIADVRASFDVEGAKCAEFVIPFSRLKTSIGYKSDDETGLVPLANIHEVTLHQDGVSRCFLPAGTQIKSSNELSHAKYEIEVLTRDRDRAVRELLEARKIGDNAIDVARGLRRQIAESVPENHRIHTSVVVDGNKVTVSPSAGTLSFEIKPKQDKISIENSMGPVIVGAGGAVAVGAQLSSGYAIVTPGKGADK